MSLFSWIVLAKILPPSFSSMRVATAYFSHTSRVMKGGSITWCVGMGPPMSLLMCGGAEGTKARRRGAPRSRRCCEELAGYPLVC